MPVTPNVSFTILSNGLGNVAPSPAGTIAVFGCSASGTAASPSGPYRRPGDVVTDYGYGPGPELVANLVKSGIPTIFTKVATNTAGVASAVTHVGTGTSVLSLTGTPYDGYASAIVTVTRAGTAGTDPEPGFTVTFDGGVTTSREIRVPSNRIYSGFSATTGLTLNFTAGTFVVGDTYTFTTTGPIWAAADVVTAIEALRTNKLQASLLYVVGDMDETDAATIASEVNSFLDRKKFVRILFEARDIASGETEAQWMASIEADFAPFTNDRVVVGAGAALTPSCLSGINYRRNIGWLGIVRAGIVTARTAGPTFGQDIGAVEDGALCSFYTGGAGQPVTTVYHDEALVPGLDANRFMTVTSFNGIDGYYITNPNIMSSPTSDFDLLQLGRVMDEECRVTNVFFTKQLSRSVRLNPKTGFILEKDRRSLESGNNTVLQSSVTSTGNASSARTVVATDDDIANTKTLTVTVYSVPLGYVKEVDVTMTFTKSDSGVA